MSNPQTCVLDAATGRVVPAPLATPLPVVSQDTGWRVVADAVSARGMKEGRPPMEPFELLYAQPNPGPALRDWALGRALGPLAAPEPAARTCAACGTALRRDNRKGYCAHHTHLYKPHECAVADCTVPIGGRATHCAAHARRGPTPAPPDATPCSVCAQPRGKGGAKGKCRKCYDATRTDQHKAHPAPAPSPVVVVRGVLPHLPTLAEQCGLPATCPVAPNGRHQILPFGGLRLPGQAPAYCAACQPRDAGYRQDYFGGGIR